MDSPRSLWETLAQVFQMSTCEQGRVLRHLKHQLPPLYQQPLTSSMLGVPTYNDSVTMNLGHYQISIGRAFSLALANALTICAEREPSLLGTVASLFTLSPLAYLLPGLNPNKEDAINNLKAIAHSMHPRGQEYSNWLEAKGNYLWSGLFLLNPVATLDTNHII
jgi:hypothetical protein